jgi:hypothetical protein
MPLAFSSSCCAGVRTDACGVAERVLRAAAGLPEGGMEPPLFAAKDWRAKRMSSDAGGRGGARACGAG